MEAPSPIGAMYVPSSFDESDREKKVGKEMIGKSSPIKARKPILTFPQEPAKESLESLP
jgi:hypothetical protein